MPWNLQQKREVRAVHGGLQCRYICQEHHLAVMLLAISILSVFNTIFTLGSFERCVEFSRRDNDDNDNKFKLTTLHVIKIMLARTRAAHGFELRQATDATFTEQFTASEDF